MKLYRHVQDLNVNYCAVAQDIKLERRKRIKACTGLVQYFVNTNATEGTRRR